MTSHVLAIAKASFAASLVRPDPTSVLRPEVAQFHEHFDALLKQASALNIQLCKDWLLKNITHSKTRTLALGKFLAATSSSLVKEDSAADSKLQRLDSPPRRRRQLHVLYLLNDLLHHVEFHTDSPAAKITLVESLPAPLLDILQTTSSHSLEAFPRHHAKINELLDLWAKHGFYPSTYIQKLRETASNAAKAQGDNETGVGSSVGAVDDAGQTKRDAPYIMPPSHGDPSIPFYDLPAGNMIPLIIPNSTAPINPQSMKPLQFVTGPAEPKLANTVDEFLKGVNMLNMESFADNNDGRNDVSELGQHLLRDASTGEILQIDGYYGWSQAFCEKMKSGGDIRGFGNDLDYDEGSSRSPSPHKKRRHSTSKSYSSDDGGRSRSRSHSRSIGRLRAGGTSPERSRSPSPPTDPRLHRSGVAPVQPPPPLPLPAPGPSPPPPPPFTQGFPLGPGGVPIPPRPAGYLGPWPPPPPPPLSVQQGAVPFPLGPGGPQLPNPGGWGQQSLASNQTPWAQRISSPNQGHASSYGIPAQGPPPPTFHGNFQKGGASRSNQRGGYPG